MLDLIYGLSERCTMLHQSGVEPGFERYSLRTALVYGLAENLITL